MRYTHAVVCRIPKSWKLGPGDDSSDIDIARKQHETYSNTLRKLGLDVIELPPDDNLPKSPYVEDTAVVCNGTALLTRPADESRRKEVETMKNILIKELEIPVIEIENPRARLEGGDVLFTGREFFVGISPRTNEAGALAVANAFPDYPCVPIKISDTGLPHLKACISLAGRDILCVGSSTAAQAVLKRIEREASFSYQTLTVVDDEASNCVFLNGTLIHRSQEEFPRSFKVFEDKIEFPRISLNVSHLTKSCAHLSCCCLLIRRTKITRLHS